MSTPNVPALLKRHRELNAILGGGKSRSPVGSPRYAELMALTEESATVRAAIVDALRRLGMPIAVGRSELRLTHDGEGYVECHFGTRTPVFIADRDMRRPRLWDYARTTFRLVPKGEKAVAS